jgi:hypothetical protein
MIVPVGIRGVGVIVAVDVDAVAGAALEAQGGVDDVPLEVFLVALGRALFI